MLKNSRIQFCGLKLKYQVSLPFFLLFSVFIIFHSHIWLSVIIRATMPQMTKNIKPWNISKIIIMKSRWNQEVTLTLHSEKLLDLDLCRSQNFHIHNPGKNIWNKIEKSSKTGQAKKSLISTFACFWTAIGNV